jgi:GntR family transcriptional regulator
MLNRRSPEPLYLQLKRTLVSQLSRGSFDASRFPFEHELERRYRVSRTTVRLALDALVNEGYIARQRGRGTAVVRSKLRSIGQYLVGFYDEMQATGRHLDLTTLSLDVKTAPDGVREAFEVGTDQRFYVARRLGLSDGEPLVVSTVYIPCRPGLEITVGDLRAQKSLLALFEDRLGVSIIGASRVLEAVRATKEEAALLKIRPGDPLLMKWTVVYGADGDPVLCGDARFRGDRYQYYIPFLPRLSDQPGSTGRRPLWRGKRAGLLALSRPS